MCKAETAPGVVEYQSSTAASGAKAPLPEEAYHGLTNTNRFHADDLTIKEIDGEKEMIINGRVYDVSSFLKRHPGGSIIKFQLGSDASDAYNNFHLRSPKANKMLNSLPSRPADPSYQADPLSRDYAKLFNELHEEGYFNPNPRHIAFRCAEVVAMYYAGIMMVWNGWWWLGAAVMGIAQGRCGWLQHEGGHYSLTGNIKVDRHLQMVIYGIGCGMSGCYWRNQHNKHHATPQKLGADPDLNTLPLLAFHKIIGKKAASKTWLMMQAPLFFLGPICSLVAWGWQLVQHPNHALRVKNFTELFWMATRYALWHQAFGYMGLSSSLALYAYYVAVGSSYIFINFSVSHTHKDVVPKEKHISWALYSANHTTNCSNNWFVNWWMAYLNFQIEHHLFPSMPQYNHPKISPRVKALFEKHGVEYDQRPYLECMRVTYLNLWRVGNYDYRQKQH